MDYGQSPARDHDEARVVALSDRAIGKVVRRLVALGKLELRQEARAIGIGLGVSLVALASALAGMFVIVVGAATWIARFIPAALAFVVVGLAVILLSACAAHVVVRRLSRQHLLPQTVSAARESFEVLKIVVKEH